MVVQRRMCGDMLKKERRTGIRKDLWNAKGKIKE